MTIFPVTVPYNVRRWAAIRIYVQSAWGQPWIQLPMTTPMRNGFQLMRYRRVCLPDEGTAVFRLPYGLIDARLFEDTTFESEIGAPDLHQYEVRIQGKMSSGDYKTIWWGQVVAMRDVCFPGSEIPAGDMEYHCVDGFARLRKWYLNYHQFYWLSTDYRSKGHPGYNAIHGRGDLEATSVDAEGLGFASHTWPSADASVAVMWSDQQAMEHALASSAPGLFEAGVSSSAIAAARALVPRFPLVGQTGWLSGKNSYPVRELETVRGFMERVFDRGRGKGLAFCSWDDDTGEDPASDAFAPSITIRAPVREDLEIPLPAEGSTVVYPGANTSLTTRNLHLVGDHRLGDDAQRSFQVTAVSDIEHNGVEILSEKIVSLCLLSEKDSSLAGRWLAGELTDLTAATRLERETNEAKYDHVYRRWGIPKDWDLKCGFGTGTSENRTRVDYRFDDNGLLLTPDDTNGRDTSPLLISIADRLPMYFGTDYAADPVATFHGDPPGDLVRMPVAVWIRVGDSPERYINGCHQLGMSISRHEQDLRISCSDDKGGRNRIIGDRTASLGSRYNSDQMCVLVGLELPHRLRILHTSNVTDTSNGTKTKRIIVPGHHFWVAHPGAIVALDSATKSNGGYAPKRMANGITYLRDDRDRLAVIAKLAAVWYLNRRRTATWTLSDCGFADGWFDSDEDGMEGSTLVEFAHLGDLIYSADYSGRTEVLDTPVTLEEYDHISGRYTWATSWSQYDWK